MEPHVPVDSVEDVVLVREVVVEEVLPFFRGRGFVSEMLDVGFEPRFEHG